MTRTANRYYSELGVCIACGYVIHVLFCFWKVILVLRQDLDEGLEARNRVAHESKAFMRLDQVDVCLHLSGQQIHICACNWLR